MIPWGKIIPTITIAFLLYGLISPVELYAGGRYYLTDKDGKIISEDPGNAIVTGPTNQTIILNDRGNRKVFEIGWDADVRAVVVKGEKVHLKIHSNGKIEKWTTFENEDQGQYPIFIKPIVPVVPPPAGR